MRKLTVLAMLSAGMGFGTQALADTTIGFTIYKYDDNFMSVVRQAIEKEAAADSNTRILMNDSQNSQSMQNDQVDVMLARGVQALAINLVDPAAAPTIIQKAKIDDVPVVFYNKEPSAEAMASYDKAFYVGTDSKESGIIQGDLISAQWKANPAWDKNGDGVLQYVMLKGEPGHPDAEARTTYSVQTINDNGIKTQELHMDTGMWDTAMAKDKMDAIEALRGAGQKIPVFGVDALAEALALIKSGDMAGTVLNDAQNQAKATFELARNLANGKPAAEGTQWTIENKVVRVPYVGVDINNVE